MFFFEREANAPLKFAHGAVLLGCDGFEHNGKDNLRAFHGIHAQNLRVLEKDILEFKI